MACAEVQLAHTNMMMLKVHGVCIDDAYYYSGTDVRNGVKAFVVVRLLCRSRRWESKKIRDPGVCLYIDFRWYGAIPMRLAVQSKNESPECQLRDGED
jgi:hypothetical protein